MKHRSGHRNRIGRSAGFSIMEIVAVLAIMMVLLVSGASLWKSDRARRAKRVGAELTIAQATRARSHAVATGRDSALVCVNDPATGRAGLAVVELEEGGEGRPPRGRAVARWEPLPENLVFFPQAVAGTAAKTLFDVSEWLEFSHGGRSLSGPYIRFDRRGSIVYPANALVCDIVFGAGTIREEMPYATERNNKGSVLYERVRVHRLTGRARIVNMWKP